jgi:hypothetical protein
VSYAKVYSIGALGAMLGGVAWIALAISDFAPAGVGFLEFWTPPIRFVALLGTLGGLVSLHLRQATSYGRPGIVGFSLTLIGTTILLTSNVLFLLGLAWPVLSVRFYGTLLLSVGLILLGVATLRARVLPRWCGAVLLVGVVPVFSWLGLPFGAFLGWVMLGLIWLALGYILWSERGEPTLHHTRI